MGKPPAPLDWHPYYRDRPWLLAWLESEDPFLQLPPITLQLTSPGTGPDDEPPMLRELILTKQKAAGLAPYVGRPFIYVWPVGTDQYGRHIAGAARITYLEDHPWEIQ